MGQLPLRARIAALGCRTASWVSRRSGRGEGSVIGGRVGLRIDPRLLSEFARNYRVAIISGTNGKTTTTHLTAAALRHLGAIATNAAGSNMPPGIVSALVQARGAVAAAIECDERHLPGVLRSVGDSVVVLLNLSRDQMDRAGEIRQTADKWRSAVDGTDLLVVANCDDPLIAWAAGSATKVIWVAAGQNWREDSWSCPSCGERLSRDAETWACAACGFRRPEPEWRVEGGTVVAPDGRRLTPALALPGHANVGNAAMACAAAAAMGVDAEQALPAMRSITTVAGRYATVEHGDHQLRLLLAKNAGGWTEVLDVLRSSASPVLLALNARGADGTDTSWIWDVDYQRLAGRAVVATGERRLDLAVRLSTAELPFDVAEDLDDALHRLPAGPIDVVANYTAFQQIRRELGRVS